MFLNETQQAVLDKAEELAQLVEAILEGKDVSESELMLSLNEFRMAQVQASQELTEELDDLMNINIDNKYKQ